MNANSLADALAGVARVATMMLNGKALPAIGNGELLRVDLHLVESDATGSHGYVCRYAP